MDVLPLWLVIGFICFAYFHREEDLASRINFLKKITRGILLIEVWLLPTLILTSLTWHHPIRTVSSVASGSPYLVAERKLSHA